MYTPSSTTWERKQTTAVAGKPPALSAAQLFTSQEPMNKCWSVLTAQTCATWTLRWAYCSLAKGPFRASPASLRGEGGQWQSLPFSSTGLGNICYSRRAAEAPFQSSLCWEVSDSWITVLLSKSQTSVALPRVARCIQSPDTAAVTGRSCHCPPPAERCFCPPFTDLHRCPVQAGWMKMSAASTEQMWRDHALWPGFTHHVGQRGSIENSFVRQVQGDGTLPPQQPEHRTQTWPARNGPPGWEKFYQGVIQGEISTMRALQDLCTQNLLKTLPV